MNNVRKKASIINFSTILSDPINKNTTKTMTPNP
jgi:hypothetical protein